MDSNSTLAVAVSPNLNQEAVAMSGVPVETSLATGGLAGCAATPQVEAAMMGVPADVACLTAAAIGPVVPTMLAVDFIDLLVRRGDTEVGILKRCLRTLGKHSYSVARLLAVDPAAFKRLGAVGERKIRALAKVQGILRALGVIPLLSEDVTAPEATIDDPSLAAFLAPNERTVPVAQLLWTNNELRQKMIRCRLAAQPQVTVAEMVQADRCPTWFAGRAKQLCVSWFERWRRLTEAESAASPEEQARILAGVLELEVVAALGTCCERDRRIVQERWGWDRPSVTLEKLASEVGRTRERVRQIQEDVVERLRTFTVADPRRLWALLGTASIPSLPALVPALAAHLTTPEDLAAFVGALCGKTFDDDELRNYHRIHLVPVFCTTNPLSRAMLEGLLHARTGSAEQAAMDVVRLQDLGLVEIQQDGTVSPRRLTQGDAAAQVLASSVHAGGMHWLDLAGAINVDGFCEQPVQMERESAFVRGPHVTLCGLGRYVHVQHLVPAAVSEVMRLRILSAVRGLVSAAGGGLSLKEALDGVLRDDSLRADMQCLASAGGETVYFVLRHLIRTDGRRLAGLELDGASSRDLVRFVTDCNPLHDACKPRQHRLGKTGQPAPTNGRMGLAA